MILFDVKDSDLSRATLSAKGERVRGAAIYPLFRESGEVRRLMVLLPGENHALMVPYRKGMVTVSLFGVLRFSMDLAELKSHINFSVAEVEPLFHYDPDWVLSHGHFSGYWARDLIRRTNLAGKLEEEISHLIFSRDLSSLSRLVIKPRGPELSFREMTPGELLEKAALPSPRPHPIEPSPAASEWQLDPVWKDWRDSRYSS